MIRKRDRRTIEWMERRDGDGKENQNDWSEMCIRDSAGGMGLAAGANLNPERTFPSMFEPIHGSAPDIAGTGKANPMATIWSASQMLDFFGYEQYGKLLLEAIEDVLVEGACLSPELGGTATTREVGDAVKRKVEELFQR